MRVINESRVDFKYRASEESAIITKTIVSNRVATDIINSTLLVKKYVDKSIASKFDTLLYTIEIINITREIALNVILKDIIPRGTIYIKNSLLVNGTIKKCISPEIGVSLGDICPKDTVTVMFKVVVDKVCYMKPFINSCSVTFDYIYNIEKPPQKIVINSNETITCGEENCYKQSMVKYDVNIPNCCGPINCIIGVENEVNIIKTEFVNYDCDLEKYKCIISGILIYKVKYKSRGKTVEYIKRENYIVNIIVPKGVDYFENVVFKLCTENTNIYVVDKFNLFIATLLLIKIES